MAYSDDYTGRYYFMYKSAGKNHTGKIRLPSSAGVPTSVIADIVSQAVAFMAKYLPNDFSFTDAAFAPRGSTVRVPSFVPATNPNHLLLGWDTGDGLAKLEYSGELKVHWKAPSGAMTNMSVFGFHTSLFCEDTGYVHEVPKAALVALTNYINKLNEIVVAASDDTQAAIRNYATYQRNSYWESNP